MTHNNLIDTQIARYEKFQINLDKASTRAKCDFATNDDLMARFCALSADAQIRLSIVLNCYAWSAYDLEHHRHQPCSSEGKIFHAGNPGDSAGSFSLLGTKKAINLPSIFRLVCQDGARPVHVKSGAALPVLPPHERLIAGMVCRVDHEYDFHFMARGSSGYWSNVPGYRQFPSMFDEAGNLITDPRRACITGQRKERLLFFAVPKEGLKISCDPDKICSQFTAIANLARAAKTADAPKMLAAYLQDFLNPKTISPVIHRRVANELARRFSVS